MTWTQSCASVAKQRLELGGDRRVVRAGESGRGKRRRGRSGEKLNDERESTTNAVKGEAKSRVATLRLTHVLFHFATRAVHDNCCFFEKMTTER